MHYFELYPLKPVRLTSEATSITLPQRALRFVDVEPQPKPNDETVAMQVSGPRRRMDASKSSDPDLKII